jgi:hypothetical protein
MICKNEFMSNKTFCDICNKEVKYGEKIGIWSSIADGEYCEECWKDSRNWKRIHKIEKDK